MSIEYSDYHEFDPSDLVFESPEIVAHLESLSMTELSLLRFGVIGVNESAITTRYNLREADLMGRPTKQVLGHAVVEALVPLLNGEQVARHFIARINDEQCHDENFSCDLLEPVGRQVEIRMICDPDIRTRYLLIRPPSN